MSLKTQRIAQALSGGPVDRRPYAFWTHFPGTDLNPGPLAETTDRFFRAYDLDFIKTMPNGMYMVEDLGCEVDFSEVGSGGVARVVAGTVTDPGDWSRIGARSVGEGALARELESLRILVGLVGDAAPILFTVFNPLTVAEKVSGGRCMGWIREGRDTAALHGALAAITETVAAISARAIELGAAGVFFATQTAGREQLSDAQYAEFAAPYDIAALEGARAGWFNLLHLHGDGVRFADVTDYPVQALNWHVWETAPTVAEARALTDKCLVGGIDRRLVTARNRDAVAEQIEAAWRQSHGRGHILTPGCVIRYPLDQETLAFIGQTVRSHP